MKLIDKEAVLAEIKKLNPPFYPTLAEKNVLSRCNQRLY